MPGSKGIVVRDFVPETAIVTVTRSNGGAGARPLSSLTTQVRTSLAQRSKGLTLQHIQNLEGFYRHAQKWKAGPHLFVVGQQIGVFTPLTLSGAHSPSLNKVSLGIVMLGHQKTESFDTGRVLAIRKNAVAAMATLCAILGLDSHSMRLHQENAATTHRSPGKNVSKEEVIQEGHDLIVARNVGGHTLDPEV